MKIYKCVRYVAAGNLEDDTPVTTEQHLEHDKDRGETMGGWVAWCCKRCGMVFRDYDSEEMT